jgi:hypothetical protein
MNRLVVGLEHMAPAGALSFVEQCVDVTC